MGVFWGGEMHGSTPPGLPWSPLVSPGLPWSPLDRSVLLDRTPFQKRCRLQLFDERRRQLAMPSLASTLDVMLSTANITTVDAFADWLLSAPTFIANYIRSEAAAAAVAARHADVGSQPALTSDVVETSVAEAMIAEAMCMLDEAQERERLADERASLWEGCAEFGTTLLKAAEDRTDRAQADRLAAERLAAAEHAAMQMAVQLLAAEAALADAAVERALNECAARAQAEKA